MSAKIELTEKQIAEIETLAVFLTQDQIADYLGISKRTFNNLREKDEQIEINYRKGKARGIAKIANGLFQQAVNGNTTAAMFYLKTQAGWKETQHLDHTSSDGSLKIAVNFTDDKD